MNGLIQILCFSCLFVLINSSELQQDLGDKNAIHQAYNVTNSIGRSLSRIQNYHVLQSQPFQLRFQPASTNLKTKLLDSLLENSTKCFRDLLYALQNLNGASGPWAMKMLDSYGKPASGVLEGNFQWTGEYSECLQIYAPENHDSTTGNFHGQYCSVVWFTEIFNKTLTLTSGVCLPDSCSASEILKSLSFLHLFQPVVDAPQSNGTDFPVKVKSLTCKPREKELKAPAIAIIVLLSIFCCLTILGSTITTVKYLTEKENDSCITASPVVNDQPSGFEEKQNDILKKAAGTDDDLLLGRPLSQKKFGWKNLETFLQCFCVFRNGEKLLKTTGGEGELLCIHGIRFLSMTWVILGHTYMMGFQSTSNTVDVLEAVQNFPFQVVLQGFFSVDSFFVLSGFLMTYLFLQQYAKNKNEISWPYFYIHRYLRLTPIYMIILGFSASLYLYLGSGPFWPDNDVDTACREKWWQHLLYVNNFGDWGTQCMPWSWYLANDMQFFVISPIFLITLARWPEIGYGLVALSLCGCWLANFILTYQYDLLPGMIALPFHTLNLQDILKYMDRIQDYSNMLYIKPYTRIAPYLIGMVTGHILYFKKKSNQPKHSWAFITVGWIVATTITLPCVYGLYHSDPSLLARSFYNAFNRTIFAVGLAWVIYLCLAEQGGPVNSILSFRMFIPLSRLTYSAYLIHPLIMTGYFSSLEQLIRFSHPTMVLMFLGIIMVSYALSFPVSLVFESPIIALEKLIRSKFTKKKETSVQ